MAEITASMVKDLREKTDAPMMDCKKALSEAGGDAAEGVVTIAISADGKSAAMVEVNCETDFVAKNDDFLALSNALAEMVLNQKPADVAALSALPYKGGTVE